MMTPAVAARWFGWPNTVLLAPVPLATAAIAIMTWRALDGGKAEAAPFVGSIGLFVLSYMGMAISLYPMIVPYHYTTHCGRQRRRSARKPARRYAFPSAGDPDVQRVVLPVVSREGAVRRRLPLSRRPGIFALRARVGPSQPFILTAGISQVMR